MHIHFETATFKDFEDIQGVDPKGRAHLFSQYHDYKTQRHQLNYRLLCKTGTSPAVQLQVPGLNLKSYVSLVSNDYLGFTQHPEVKKAAIQAIEKYGTGAGSSPAIGGHMEYHEQLEKAISGFFHRSDAILYTTGYTANSATIQCLMKSADLVIIDQAVHASVMEGCQLTSHKRFPHNNLEALERILKNTTGKYRTRMVIVDGVYSQDGDIAPLKDIVYLCKKYGAYSVVDDAHGTGVIGKTGRGVIELDNLFRDVDLITGTFSKTFAHIGGYVIADAELVRFLKFQSRQHLFSASSTPAAACITKAIELIDSEPFWMERLRANANYLREGLQSLGLDTGITRSAIIPVKIGSNILNAQVCRMLLEAGVYTNQINYPAVAMKDARIRMSVMATHTTEQLDEVLNAWEWVKTKTNIKNFE